MSVSSEYAFVDEHIFAIEFILASAIYSFVFCSTVLVAVRVVAISSTLLCLRSEYRTHAWNRFCRLYLIGSASLALSRSTL